jgi:hypothetical protein
MQTPGLPASPANATRHPANNFTSEKPAHNGEHFGAVMNRALSDPSSPKNKKSSEETNATKSKHPKAMRNHEDSTASATSPSLAFAAAPTPAPQPAPNQSSNTHDSNETAGSANIVFDTIASAEAADADATQTETAPEASDADSKSIEITDFAEHSESPTTVTATATAAEQNPEAADLTDLLAADASEVEMPQITGPTESAGQVSPITPDLHGTSAAKQDMTMKKAQKTPKVAGQAEQDLPGITATSSEELPEGQKLSPKAPSHGTEKLENAAIELPTRISTSVDSPAPTATATAVSPAGGLDTRVLERTHDIVALHAMRLSEYSSESLHVVVKPGAGIQLSLELHQSARGIEVRASLDKGDFEQLNQYWPELQERLEARGIRVGTLTTAENFTSTSHQQFQQSKQQPSNQDPLYAGAFAEFALAGSMTEAPDARAARAAAYRGWETWA